ncbi:hypothetical protein BDD12DRAFT_810558 [Trichophaea hybrida]|nr:hypothetical protein BDD12DRAFT_810558 [Trichophaea hybrida]
MPAAFEPAGIVSDNVLLTLMPFVTLTFSAFTPVSNGTHPLPNFGSANEPAQTVPPISSLSSLLALTLLCCTQPSHRICGSGKWIHRFLRVSPVFCILDRISILGGYISLLLHGLKPIEAAQTLVYFLYSVPPVDDISTLWAVARNSQSMTVRWPRGCGEHEAPH